MREKRLKDLSARYAVEEAANFSNHAVNPVQSEGTGTGGEEEGTKTPKEYTYDYLVSQPPMKKAEAPALDSFFKNGKISSKLVKDAGIKNAKKNASGSTKEGSPIITNRYTGQDIIVTGETIVHGLNGKKERIFTNARLGAVIGDLVRNGIPLNDLRAKETQEKKHEKTYVIGAYATSTNKDGAPLDCINF